VKRSPSGTSSPSSSAGVPGPAESTPAPATPVSWSSRCNEFDSFRCRKLTASSPLDEDGTIYVGTRQLAIIRRRASNKISTDRWSCVP
jgi:hypothetical protein